MTGTDWVGLGRTAAGAMPSTTAPAGQPAAGGDGSLQPVSAVRALDASPAATGRKVVSSAAITVRTDDLTRTKAEAASLVRGAGGDVYQEATSFGRQARSELTMKVPPDRFDRILTDFGALGTLLVQEIKTEDVTQQVIDLDARVRTTEAAVASVQGFVAKSTNIVETAQLENELQRRIGELESLRAQRQILAKRVDLATIVLTLVSDEGTAGAEAETAKPAAEPIGFNEGLDGGLNAAGRLLRGLAVATGAALPFSPLLLALALVVRWRRRHRAATTS